MTKSQSPIKQDGSSLKIVPHFSKNKNCGHTSTITELLILGTYDDL